MKRVYQRFYDLEIVSDVKEMIPTKELNKIVANAVKAAYKEKLGFEPEVNVRRHYFEED